MKKIARMRITVSISITTAFLILVSVPSYASTVFNGETVTGVGTYGNGALFIFVSTPINAPGCNANATRIDVQASNPNIKQYMAIAIAALSSGAQLDGAVNGCDPDNGNPTLDQSYASYIYEQ